MKLFGLIGYPLEHSFSKQYFTEKFEREGMTDCQFEAFPIVSIHEFPALLKSNPGLKGLSVTIPYKEQVLQFVDEVSEEVKAIGATNSIKIKNGRLTACNTDIAGFEKSFVKSLRADHKNALVLGTGGASKAVQFVLNKLGVGYLIVSRNKDQKQGCITYADIDEIVMKEYSVIINCSPAGMYPNDQIAPAIPYELLTPSHYLYDLVYKPAKTLFLQKGEAMGAIVENGYEMLLIQAEESWRIWNED
ncbi:MAG: shikimate dehydrogenase [Chitinophagaceae bacterium]|nr:shikimate dehydrogenase [Chitinophagaceae bacterium]